MTPVSFNQLRTGDKIVVTPLRGSRFGIKIENIYDTFSVVSGVQFRLGDPSVLFHTHKMARLGSSVKKVELV